MAQMLRRSITDDLAFLRDFDGEAELARRRIDRVVGLALRLEAGDATALVEALAAVEVSYVRPAPAIVGSGSSAGSGGQEPGESG
jgi:hypothetical protein